MSHTDVLVWFFFFFKQKTAYEMRISDWSSDVCSSDLVLREIIHRCPWLRHVFADGGYAGDKLREALRRIGKWTVEIVKRSDVAKGFVVLPSRWVVERPLAWLNRNRRLAKDFGQTEIGRASCRDSVYQYM